MPRSVALKDGELWRLLEGRQFQEACSRFRISEIVTSDVADGVEMIPDVKTIFHDGAVRVIALDCPGLAGPGSDP